MAKKLYSHNAEHEKRRRVSIPKEPILDQPDGFTKESLTVTMASVRKALDFAGIQNTGIQAGIRDGSIVWLANIKTDDGSPRTFSGQIPFVDGMNIRRNLRYMVRRSAIMALGISLHPASRHLTTAMGVASGPESNLLSDLVNAECLLTTLEDKGRRPRWKVLKHMFPFVIDAMKYVVDGVKKMKAIKAEAETK